jgi:hypothetical protein
MHIHRFESVEHPISILRPVGYAIKQAYDTGQASHGNEPALSTVPFSSYKIISYHCTFIQELQ